MSALAFCRSKRMPGTVAVSSSTTPLSRSSRAGCETNLAMPTGVSLTAEREKAARAMAATVAVAMRDLNCMSDSLLVFLSVVTKRPNNIPPP